MRNNVKDIDTKSCTYYFINNMINIKNFDPNDIKIDQKVIQKYFYLLQWICDNQRFEVCTN